MRVAPMSIDQRCGNDAAGHAHKQIFSQPEEPVVPALAEIDQRQAREIRVLLLEQARTSASSISISAAGFVAMVIWCFS
jgi:hypothetical protein